MEHTIRVPHIDEIKAHVKRNKNAYIVGGVGIMLAGVAYYIGARSESTRILSPSIVGNNNKLDQRIITLVERPGPPSYVIGRYGTDEEWMSQRAAALAEGLRVSDLRAHLNGMLDELNGKRYYRKGLAAA